MPCPRLAEADAEERMNRLFGHAEKESGQKGKLLFHEVELGEVCPSSIPHVAIDRFSGGALDGALFSEGPVWKEGLSVGITLSLNGLEAYEAALLFHALFDMAEGALPLGGGAGRGCGRLLLRHWKENPAKALSSWEGTLYRNGEALCVSDAEAMRSVFVQLDEELDRVLEA